MTEFETRRDPSVTTSDYSFVSPEDWESFHNITAKDGEGYTVAVNDSGIDSSHPIWDYYGIDLQYPEIDGLPTNSTDRVGHGTGVAGLVAMMAPKVNKIVDVPIFGAKGRTGMAEIQRAYEWLISHSDEIDFVNMSWGTSSKIPQIDQLHNKLEQAGVQAIVAAGNTNQQTGSPATAERAFSVSACTLNGEKTRWTSPTDNVTALGSNIALPASENGHIGKPITERHYSDLMKEIGGNWVKASGTSFSAPGVCGMTSTLASQLASSKSADTRKAYEQRFMKTAEEITGTSEDGVGYVNFKKALNFEQSGTVPVTVWSLRDGEDFYHVEADVVEDGEYEVDPEKLADVLRG